MSCAPGLCKDPICLEGRARWYCPEISTTSNNNNPNNANNRDDIPPLKVHNSITDHVDVFRPRTNRTVSWYTCGPTVYAPCHMGHARAYLTFEIQVPEMIAPHL